MSRFRLLDLPNEILDHIIGDATDYARHQASRLAHTCTRLYALCERHRYRTLELYTKKDYVAYLCAFLRRPQLLANVRHMNIHTVATHESSGQTRLSSLEDKVITSKVRAVRRQLEENNSSKRCRKQVRKDKVTGDEGELLDPLGLDRLSEDQRALLLHCAAHGLGPSSGPIVPATHNGNGDGDGGHWIDQLLQSGRPADYLRAALLCLARNLESVGQGGCYSPLWSEEPIKRRVEEVYATSDRLRNCMHHVVQIPYFHFSDPCSKCGSIHSETEPNPESEIFESDLDI